MSTRVTPVEGTARSSGLLSESISYMSALNERGHVESISEMLTATSYVYLTRPARVRLAWRVLLTIFR